MSIETLKDAHYRTIGFIETRQDGVQVGKDAHYRVVGFYYPDMNQTKDAHYRVVAMGNTLPALVTQAHR